jgi:hypothetical protein
MKSFSKYFIQEHLHREVFHGGISNVFVEKILLSRGYKAIEFPGTFDFSLPSKLKRFIYLLKMLFSIQAGDIVVFQFPLYARIHLLLLKLLRKKGVHIVCLITDIEGMRILDTDMLAKEKRILSGFSLFISHNKRMTEWLRSVVIPRARGAMVVEIGFFDYLATPAKQYRHRSMQIAFAGNLEKSPFIQHLEQVQATCANTTFLIYGPGYPKHLPFPANAVFKGILPPNDLVQHIEGSFGLLWDGGDISNCTGHYGEYLSYNSPHKLSLYILAGIPLIVPDMSASALLVKQYGIGITIKQLGDIEQAINTITDAEYKLMVDNTRSLANDISKGNRLEGALNELLEKLMKIDEGKA